MALNSINPTTGAPFATYEEWHPDAVKHVIEKVHHAHLAWRRTRFEQRAPLMRKAADLLRKNARNCGPLITEEMGKPIRESIAELQRWALCCDFYADNAEHFLAREPVHTEASKSFVAFNPIGVVLAVMPWNFPFWQVFWFAALDGSDPYVILEDADIELAATVCAKGRLVNSGQSCIAAKRFIVIEDVRREFENRFVGIMSAVKLGDPFDEAHDIGPLPRHDLRDALHQQVLSSINRGARVLLGGAVPNIPGAYYSPPVLTDVHKGMAAYEEELFGPVAVIIPAQDEAEVIVIANDTVFGLGGGVMTSDLARGERIAEREIESGSVFVNDSVHSDPRLPFGGVKESGYGRELSSYGIKEFVNIKTVVVA